MEILDGTKVAYNLKQELKKQVQQDYLAHGKIPPMITIINVGDDPASKIYVANKIRVCEQVGVNSNIIALPSTTTEEELSGIINGLNCDPKVNGILLQLPLPAQIDEQKMIDLIAPLKDVDGLTSQNISNLVIGKSNGLCGCTPKGIITMLKAYDINLKGKHAVIINRSLIVGKQLAFMLLNENATVTICHSKTNNLAEITKSADIVIIAVGRKGFLTGDMIKEGAVVVDVGINRIEGSKKIYGDADWESISQKASFASPVPHGVGPMTTSTLLQNTLLATKLQQNLL